MLDEEPLVSFASRASRAGFDEDKFALKFAAFEREFEIAFIQKRVSGLFHFGAGVFARRHEWGPCSGVPNFDGSGTVIAFGDGALEIEVADRVILDHHGETLIGRVE